MNQTKTTSSKKGTDLLFILSFYDAYLRERSVNKAAASLEISQPALENRINNSKELQLAMSLAEKNRSKNLFRNYVLRNLSKEAQEIWRKLNKEADSYESIEKIFKGKPVKLRQQLFVHAIMHTGFDISKACRIVGIGRERIEAWKNDLEFLQLLEEVQFHKKNFYEQSLNGLVAEGHPGAIIFVNRTYNADRGYNEKFEINTSPRSREDFSIDELDLEPEILEKVLEAIERKKNKAPLQIASRAA